MILKQLQAATSKQERLDILKENKDSIIKEKRSMVKIADPVFVYPSISKAVKAQKAESNIYDIVGNSVGFMDSHHDVSMSGSFNKTVQEGAKTAPFLKNHTHSLDGIIGLNRGVRVGQVAIRELGFDRDGFTEAFIMSAEPMSMYDEKLYSLYKEGQVRQHSIGLQYVKIELAVNDPDMEDEYKSWQRNIDKVINREMADEYGYFFPVLEQRVIELSAVLWGSNPYTPVIQDNKQEPSTDTLTNKRSQATIFYQSLVKQK
jgi:hypothetical protein